MNNPTLGGSCTTRMSRADSDVSNRVVDMNSRTRRTCYPRGSLSVRTDSHTERYRCSLSHAFAPAIDFVTITVSPTFVFDPLKRISDALELSFGRLCFLIEGVPPQSNHPPAAVLFLRKVSNTVKKEQCYIVA